MSIFDDMNPDNTDYIAENEEKTEILDNLVKELTLDDLIYMFHARMEIDCRDAVISRMYNEDTGNKLVYFRLKAECNYYLEDSDEW